MNSSRKWPRRAMAVVATAALIWWWIGPSPAAGWSSSVAASATCDGWSLEVSGYSPETMVASFDPSSEGSWGSESTLTVTVNVGWTDYTDIQAHVVTLERPSDCEESVDPPPEEPEVPEEEPEVPEEEPPVLIPPIEEWRTPPPSQQPPPMPAKPAEPREGQPTVTG